MKDLIDKSAHNEETDADRLEGLLADDALSLDLVSAFAGDRPLTKAEVAFLDNMKKIRGDSFYGDLLYAISHQFFQPEVAKSLWEQILRHKYEMSKAMNRNIRIVVAALDRLCNIAHDFPSATLIGEKQIADIVRTSLRDGLTGLYNHAYCYHSINTEIKRCIRYGTTVSLMMIDIDDFKNVNDLYGHLEGDKVLARIGAIIKNETRECDICCRYGGEEFVVILPATDSGETMVLAERLRSKIEQNYPAERMVTVSIGVASFNENNSSSKSLINIADKALYEAKAAGKNRVVMK